MDELNSGISVVKLLKQVMDKIKDNVKKAFKDIGLTGSQGMLVGILSNHGDMKISDLSKKMGLSNSTVSGIVDRLEREGIVERNRSREDRRVVLVSLSSQFKIESKKYFKQTETRIDNMMSEATSEEIEKVYEGLDILKRVMERKQQ